MPDAQDPQCGLMSPCPELGKVCTGGVCATGCSTNGDCAAGELCDWSLGACINDPSIKTVCSMSSQCVAASPQTCGGDGFCHYTCLDLAKCKQIDSRYDFCDAGICKTLAEKSPQCTTQILCPPGKDCISNKCL